MSSFQDIKDREQGLQRRLSAGQMSMIAIGGAIGTGLFLGSKFAIGFAGPSVVLSYAIGGLITLLLMGRLAEMTVAHATSGSFGAYAEHYVSPLAGFLVRYSYWACIVLAVGTEVTAVAEYMRFWFPDTPPDLDPAVLRRADRRQRRQRQGFRHRRILVLQHQDLRHRRLHPDGLLPGVG